MATVAEIEQQIAALRARLGSLEAAKDAANREISALEAEKSLLSRAAREQFQRQVLENPDQWYNGIIQCRIHRSHVLKVPALIT
jgi:septal ring factor EnvC (AmiA/AmiB activator)